MSDEYVRLKDMTRETHCMAVGPVSDGGWHYHCFRDVDHRGAHEAMAAEGESRNVTAAGTVRWPRVAGRAPRCATEQHTTPMGGTQCLMVHVSAATSSQQRSTNFYMLVKTWPQPERKTIFGVADLVASEFDPGHGAGLPPWVQPR